MSAGLPAAVLGATGYVGGELLRLIAAHPQFVLGAAVSGSRAGSAIGDAFPHLGPAYASQTFAAHDDWVERFDRGSPLALFSAAPHGSSAELIRRALESAARRELDVHVVDVSADFRYARQSDFENVYGVEHGAPELLPAFDGGVPEHVPTTTARHIGHPGCFATAALLAAVPLLASGLCDDDLYVTGITGSTGSGRQAQAGTHHPERHSNLYAYKPLSHRHAPEIVALSARATGRNATVNFVPHSGPFARGIYVTVQARARDGATRERVRAAFDDAYRDSAFVGVVESAPRLKNVVASNRADIGIAVDAHAIAVTCAIDNLVKGAAGGAVQWMNRLFGLPETTGLLAPAPAWT
ncbi:MAG: N-acetyl-gamma-glutamyl-phosphate reductase [Woeseiaceae bacterium]|nr:N-acetyl-gamma-glutamyl-phosphate reductase [Woeseiaceae bacterium]